MILTPIFLSQESKESVSSDVKKKKIVYQITAEVLALMFKQKAKLVSNELLHFEGDCMAFPAD